MARNESKRFREQSADRAQLRASTGSLRASAESWRALANFTVASTLVVAVFLSALTLLEAVFANPTQQLARRSTSPSEPQTWHARSPVREPFLPTPVEAQPVLSVAH